MTALRVFGLGVALPPAGVPAGAAGWFDVAAALPGRGYRRVPLGCQYLLAAARDAASRDGAPLAAVPEERRGVIVATNNAVLAVHEAQDQAIITAGADTIAPLTAPYFAMSLFAARLATEHAARGFTLTVNTPRTAGLDALHAGARALAAGRAGLLLVGVTEEALPAGEPGAEGSDAGAVVLVCGPAGPGRAGPPGPDDRALGDCTVRNAFLPPGRDPADVLDSAWDDLTAGSPAPIQAVLDDSHTGKAVARWLAAKAGRGGPVTSAPAGAGCLSPLRHLAAGLTPAGPSSLIVVTAAAQGHVALARLTRNPFTLAARELA